MQTNGKMEKNAKQMFKLQDLIGLQAKNTYGANTVEELDNKMSEMFLIDLQKLAISSGIPGGGDCSMLKRKIRNEFLKFKKGADGVSFAVSKEVQFKGKDAESRKAQALELMRV